jgi:hypothetical protein
MTATVTWASPVPTSARRVPRACANPACDGVFYTAPVVDPPPCPHCGVVDVMIDWGALARMR